MPTARPIIGSQHIAGVSPTPDGNGQLVPIRIVVDDTYDPPRLVIELPDRALRDLGKVDIAQFDVQVPASTETSTVYNATTALTPKFALANVAASTTDGNIVSAVASKKIRVLAAAFMAGGTATNVTFNSKPAGAGTAISALFAAGANGGASLPFSPVGWFETTAGQGLTVTTGAGSTVGIVVVYVEV